MAEALHAERVAALVRLVLDLRLAAVLLTVLWLGRQDEVGGMLPFGITAVSALALVPLLRWERWGPRLMHHPALLAGESLFAVVVLAVAGPMSPFLLFTLGTAVLAGVLYGWRGAVFFAALLVVGYGWALAQREGIDHADWFHLRVVLPALYPLAAAGAAAVRSLLVRHDELARGRAAADERTRLAREMHDSLAKTLHGIALSATAVSRLAERDPARAAGEARRLAQAADAAAAEGRALISDLRADSLDLPLGRVVAAQARAWGARTGTTVSIEGEAVGGGDPSARYELLAIVREALTNVERHAGASAVTIQLAEGRGEVTVTVGDDGAGFVTPADVSDLADAGRYGLVGMQERARRCGGALSVDSSPGRGTRLEARVPAAPSGRTVAFADLVRSQVADSGAAR